MRGVKIQNWPIFALQRLLRGVKIQNRSIFALARAAEGCQNLKTADFCPREGARGEPKFENDRFLPPGRQQRGGQNLKMAEFSPSAGPAAGIQTSDPVVFHGEQELLVAGVLLAVLAGGDPVGLLEAVLEVVAAHEAVV